MSKHRNEALYQAMVELRRSSAASPHRNKKRYTRKEKHKQTRPEAGSFCCLPIDTLTQTCDDKQVNSDRRRRDMREDYLWEVCSSPEIQTLIEAGKSGEAIDRVQAITGNRYTAAKIITELRETYGPLFKKEG